MDKKSECFAPYFLLQIRALSSLFVTPAHPTFSQAQYQPALSLSLSGGSDQGLIVTSVDALIELEGNFRGGELRRPIGPAKELEIKRDREIEMEIKE